MQQLSERQVQRLRQAGKPVITQPPPDVMVPRLDLRSGKVVMLPRGVDAAFAYDMGKRPMRAVTPEPVLTRDPYSSKATSKVALAMPPPRAVDKALLLPEGIDPLAAVDAFLAEFGAKRGGPPVLFTDPLGEKLVVSDELFKNAEGEWKLYRGREHYVALLARAVRDPDEIWGNVERHRIRDKDISLRRYFARFRVEGHDQPLVAVFEWGDRGWTGVTTFQADPAAPASESRGTLKRMRRGVRLYLRGGEPQT